MNSIDNSLAQKIENEGFVVIRGVLSTTEVKKLRKIVKNHFNNKGLLAFCGLVQPNAAVEVSEINWLFYHPTIITVMRHLLRQEKIMFTSHCDIHSGTLSRWHKDDGMTVMDGGYFGQSMYKEQDCRVYKVAIYLQNHTHNNGGLTVRRGSHKFQSLDKGEEIYLKTYAGDIVIFDVRLTHIGQRDIVPIPLLRKPINLFQNLLKKLLKIDEAKIQCYLKTLCDKFFSEKLAIFFTYGVPNEHTIAFANNNMKRQTSQLQTKDIFLSTYTRQKLLENNVLLAEDYFSNFFIKEASRKG
jgi:hypothetical protein